MSVETLCNICRELLKVRQTEEILRAQSRIEKMIHRMRPARRHQHFSIMLGRYVDDGE